MKRKFVQVDQAGAEALIVAYLCRPAKFRDLFLTGVKPHVYVALNLFLEEWSKMPDKINNNDLVKCAVAEPKDLKAVPGWKAIENVIKDSDKTDDAGKRYYFLAKQVCHSSNYAIKARAFRLNLLLKSDGAVAKPVTECETMLERYHAMFPEIREWNQDVVARVQKTSLLRNLFGHPRVFTGPKDENAWKEWLAYVPQSTVGQITNYAFVELQEEIQAGKHPDDIDILENNHDSILAQCLPENVEYTARLLSSKLNRALVSPRGEHFNMKSEAQVGDNWYNMKEIKL